MKRIHLFEFEDFKWFPSWLRDCMTNYIVAFHKILATHEQLAGIINKGLKHSKKKHVLDMCSGSGGPMLDVKQVLKDKHNIDVKFSFSDLYPHKKFANKINAKNDPSLTYLTGSVNATKVDKKINGLRTMICSMHHMKPDIAKGILKDAKDDNQPICIYEISDNGFPIFLWWIAIPFGFIMTFLFTPLVRPFTWQQFTFTYLIPILPLMIAWDGAVSNARTYTINDMKILLEGLEDDTNYKWEMDSLKGKGGNKLYLLGLPQNK